MTPRFVHVVGKDPLNVFVENDGPSGDIESGRAGNLDRFAGVSPDVVVVDLAEPHTRRTAGSVAQRRIRNGAWTEWTIGAREQQHAAE
jgi:hypothetical protein